jgi:Xaa-Pro aminopeptidase
VEILKETDIDLWLTFVRETTELNDPNLPYIAGTHVVWQSAFTVTRTGEKIAIVGSGDTNNILRLEVYDEVIGYDQSIRAALVGVLDRFNPMTIGLNYSEDNNAADGITHGMYLRLCRLLADTPYPERFISAEPATMKIRGRKSLSEIRLTQEAITTTMELFHELTRTVALGWTEKDVLHFLHRRMSEIGVGPAWAAEYCPSVNSGLDSLRGHAPPGDVVIEPGHILRLDFGVKQNEYCSDLQRVWYFLKPGETAPPDDVQQGFKLVQQVITSAAAMMKPGVIAFTVDELGREIIQDAGYPEFMHALGHQVGRNAHDGGTVLGPRWERYGQRPYDALEKDQVYTLELGVRTSAGYVAQEEMVLITENGCEFLSDMQKEIFLIPYIE